MTPAEFDQRRAYLDELLSRPHLWPGQVAQAQGLAEELGVRIVIVDKAADWNYQVNPWTVRSNDG